MLVTGGAGFIGSNLVDRFLAPGCQVTSYRSRATDQQPFREQASTNLAFRLVEADLLNTAMLQEALAGHDLVFHLAADAVICLGTDHPRRDLEQNVIAARYNKRQPDPAMAYTAYGASLFQAAAIEQIPSDEPYDLSSLTTHILAAEGRLADYEITPRFYEVGSVDGTREAEHDLLAGASA